jgi:hypothetical protein
MQRTIKLPAYILLLAVLFSCGPQKKAVTSTKNELSAVGKQLTGQNKKLDDLETLKKNKLEQNELDDTASARIQKFIDNTRGEIEVQVSENEVLIGSTIVSKQDWERLKKALTLSQNSLQAITTKVNFINDMLTRNTVVKLDQDLLFGPGQYTVTKDMEIKVGSFFEPTAKEIDYFVQKYPDFPLSLVITAKGYADGTAITEGSKLYNELRDRLRLSGVPPDQKELNKELSRARAEEVINLFKKFTTGRAYDGTNIRNILYLYEGKGDAFPYKHITDYKTNDPRRRVVLLFWSLFPE